MKIKKIYISSFGKLKDFTYDLTGGINVINEENGWGKSTLTGFIKCMFFGISNDRKRAVSENERLLYKPWNSIEKFGGYLVFEKLGKDYKIERYFGNKEAEDTVRFTDVSTGKEYNPQDLGKRAFEIDEDGFLSTVFFSQKDFEIKSNSSLTTKFNELYEIESENTFEDAFSLLDSKRKDYVKTGDKGLINETKRAILSITEKINKSEKCAEQLSVLKNQKQLLEKEIEEVSARQKAVTEKITNATKNQRLRINKENYDALTIEKEETMQELNAPQRVINGNSALASKINEISSSLIVYRSEIEATKKKQEDVSKLEEEIRNEKARKNSKFLFVIPAILLVISIIFAFVSLPIFIVGLILSALSFIGILFATKNKKDSAKESYLNMLKDELETKLERIKQAEDYLNSYFANFNIDPSFSFEQKCEMILNAVNNVNILSARLKNIQEKIDKLSIDKGIFNLPKEQEDIDALNSEQEKISEELKEKTKKYQDINSNMRYYENEAEELFLLENERQELTDNLREYTEDYQVILKTIEFFVTANDNLKSKYKAPLEESLNKYLSYIDDKKISAKIDIDLKVSISEKTGETDVNYYSKGYRDLIEICKRFALIDVLYKKDKPFIILDDPFYNLDEKKIENATNLIKKLSNEYQIIYLICHKSRGLN